jgi:hypothetical protein
MLGSKYCSKLQLDSICLNLQCLRFKVIESLLVYGIDFCVLMSTLSLCLIAQLMLSSENFGSLCQDLKHLF